MTGTGEASRPWDAKRSMVGATPPHERRSAWLPSAELRRIVREASADAGLLDDLAVVRAVSVEDE